MRVIVAGSRAFNDLPLMVQTLTKLLGNLPDLEIVSGMAKGADIMAYNLAIANKVPVKPFPADWQDMSEPCLRRTNSYGDYNALAGNKRNKQMGDYADMLIAFSNGSSGTADMIAYMRQLKKTVHVIPF